jgi:hypothetical protein
MWFSYTRGLVFVCHTPRLIGLVRWVLQPIDVIDVLWVDQIDDGTDFFIRLVYRCTFFLAVLVA